jgi:hypothetical protein
VEEVEEAHHLVVVVAAQIQAAEEVGLHHQKEEAAGCQRTVQANWPVPVGLLVEHLELAHLTTREERPYRQLVEVVVGNRQHILEQHRHHTQQLALPMEQHHLEVVEQQPVAMVQHRLVVVVVVAEQSCSYHSHHRRSGHHRRDDRPGSRHGHCHDLGDHEPKVRHHHHDRHRSGHHHRDHHHVAAMVQVRQSDHAAMAWHRHPELGHCHNHLGLPQCELVHHHWLGYHQKVLA